MEKWHQIQNFLGILLKLFGMAKLKDLYLQLISKTLKNSCSFVPKNSSDFGSKVCGFESRSDQRFSLWKEKGVVEFYLNF